MKGKVAATMAWLVLGIVGLALIGALILEAQAQPPNAGRAAQPQGLALTTEERIQAQVAEVSAESFAESVENLVKPDMYFWPGAIGERSWTVRFPLEPRDGWDDVPRILSNRRFLRAYEEFAGLNPKDASAVLVDAFARFLKSYCAALDEGLTAMRSAPPPPPGLPVSGVSFQVGGPSGGRLNPVGERYRLLALVLIAGNLGFEGAHVGVQDVVKQALADRERFYAEGEFSRGFRHGMLVMASLYNRQILAHALLRTSPDKARVAQVWATLGKEMQTKDVPVFNAAWTEQDGHFAGKSPDFSKGVLRVEYLPPLSDDEFNLVVDGLMPKEKTPGP